MRKTGKILLTAVCAAFIAGALAGPFCLSAAYAADADYYAPVTAAGGTQLLGQLHDLITTTHTHYSSYSECRDNTKNTDPALNGEKGVVEFYTHETIEYYINDISTPKNQGTWNREHVWPKACSNGLWGTEGGGADMHHIRPSEVTLNGARGNKKFGEAANGGEVYSKTTDGNNSKPGGRQAGNVFEPLDDVKGDVARIVLYVYTHYNTYANVYGSTNGARGDNVERYFGTLRFTDIVSASSEEAAIGLLLEWNELDPVDAIERTRNEEAYKVQGNRNPYIDHPEYAGKIWESADPPDGDPAAAAAFHAAVGSIVQEGSLAAQYASLQRAAAAYRALTETQRQAAEEDADKFEAAVREFNEAVAACNGAAKRAEDGALGAAGGLLGGGGQ